MANQRRRLWPSWRRVNLVPLRLRLQLGAESLSAVPKKESRNRRHSQYKLWLAINGSGRGGNWQYSGATAAAAAARSSICWQKQQREKQRSVKK